MVLIQPSIEQSLQSGLQHHRSGRFGEAEKIYRQILAREPNQPDALHLLGMIALQVGHPDAGIDLVKRAIAIEPRNANYHTTLGNGLNTRGHRDEAILEYRRALALAPDHADAHNNLGIVLTLQGKFDDAVAAFREAIRISPHAAQVHWNLGNTLRDKGSLDEAIAAFREAIRLNPDFVHAYNNLGVVLSSKGLIDDAIAMYLEAIRLDPNSGVAYCNLGRGFFDKGMVDEAIKTYRKSIQLSPKSLETWGNLGNALRAAGLLDDALAAHQEALRIRPDHPETLGNIGNVLRYQGLLAEATASYRRAVELNPRSPSLHSSFVFALHYDEQSDPQTLLRESVKWAERHAYPLKRFIPTHTNERSPERRLKIGYVSPDFHEHPVGRYLFPLLAGHDAERFEIFCYSDVVCPDALTQRMRGYAHQWRQTVGVSHQRLAEQIYRDGIDILIDLTAHTAEGRLLVFARKPAPVQATYLAYPGTTGLDTIDYRITDPYIDPPGVTDEDYSERSLRLPETFWCYEPGVESSVSSLPAASAGFITFGCLNNFAKINSSGLRLWCALLKKVANSRLLLHAREGGHRERVRQVLSEFGIDCERVDFVGKVSLREYMEEYHRIDIGLDPFPYVGGTTTCDALWMGVPVVTLKGRTAVGRTGVSVLMNVGLPKLIAETLEQYEQIATTLAGDVERLGHIRSMLREQMKASPLMNAVAFVRNMEAAYRRIWVKWCSSGK